MAVLADTGAWLTCGKAHCSWNDFTDAALCYALKGNLMMKTVHCTCNECLLAWQGGNIGFQQCGNAACRQHTVAEQIACISTPVASTLLKMHLLHMEPVPTSAIQPMAPSRGMVWRG